MYYLQTLGRLSVHPESPERPPLLSDSKSLAVLAYLCVERGSPVSRDRIATLFWPDADRARARQSLRQALYYLSTKVDGQLVDADQHVVTVRDDGLDVDVWAFDRALAEGDYERVLELHDGPFLAGVEEKLGREIETWVEAQNERIWTGLQASLHRLVLESLEGGNANRALHFAKEYVELNPFREDAQLALIQSLAAADRPVAAIQAYQSYRSLLREELEDEPGSELRDYVSRLRARVFRTPRVASSDERDRSAGEPRPGAGVAAGRRSQEGTGGTDPEIARARPGSASSERGSADVGGAWRPIVSAAAVLVLLALLARTDRGSGPATGPEPPPGPWARVQIAGAGGGTFSVVPDGDSVALEPLDRSWSRLSRPGGGAAGQVRTPRGYDLALLDGAGNVADVLLSRDDDEVPKAWSPDGRLLAIQAGFMGTDGVHYQRRLAILDVDSGHFRRIRDRQTRVDARADWAPSGAWLVFGALDESGDHEVYRVLPDGTGATNLSRSPGFDGQPAWSPGGRWIAFASERTGSRGIHLVAPDGERVTPLVDSGFDDHQPVWIDRDHLLYLSTRRDETNLWIYDLATDERRRLTTQGDLTRIRPVAPSARRWIEELRLRPRPRRLSPGQWLRLTVDGSGPDGQPVPVPEGVVAWSVEEGPVRRRSEDGLFRVVDTGPTRISAAVPGWRRDHHEAVSRPLTRFEASPTFRETWAEGIRPERWHSYGSPAPGIVRRPGRFGRALRSNGDAHFDSGVASRARFRVDGGATLEVWARIPLGNRHYQGLQMALVPEPAPPGTVAWSAPGDTPLRVALSGHPRGTHLRLFEAGRPVPPPDSLGRWRRYALQVDGRGVPSFVVDGRLHWQGEPLPNGLPDDAVHVVLAGRTVDTDILVGPVTLYDGLRYRITGPSRVTGTGKRRPEPPPTRNPDPGPTARTSPAPRSP